MSKTFFGFALADSMLVDGVITRRSVSVDEVKHLVSQGVDKRR